MQNFAARLDGATALRTSSGIFLRRFTGPRPDRRRSPERGVHYAHVAGASPCCLQSVRRHFSTDGQAILDRAPELIVMSLDPHRVPLFSFSKKNAGPTFHGYRILREVKITDAATRTALIGKLYSAIAGEASPAHCFNPRHGLRAVAGEQTVDLVICFECRQIESHISGKQGGGFVAPSAEPAFEERQAEVCAELWEFGVCAGLLEER